MGYYNNNLWFEKWTRKIECNFFFFIFLVSGNISSILPTMLGGSASSQTSGAPFRTETDSRATVWPPPAHQNDLYTRGCGIYSLFPGPGDNGKNLYSSPAKSAHSGNPFPGFLETSKGKFFNN